MNLPEWINAIVACIAVIFAAIAAHQAKQIYLLEQERDANAEKQNRRQYASKITAWIAAHIDHNGDWQKIGIVIQNPTDSAIFKIEVIATNSKQRPAAPLTIDILPPGKFFVLAKPPTSFADFCLAENNTNAWDYAKPYEYFDCALTPMTMQQTRKIITFTFTDSNNRRWQRNEHGQLSEITEA